MKSGVLLVLLLGMLPSAVAAHQVAIPTKGAHIVKFYVTGRSERFDAGPGPLHLVYSDDLDIEIPNETKRFGDGEEPVTQAAFSDIQLAADHLHIGWLAEYKYCGQSYECPMELVIYKSRKEPLYIRPSYGIMWKWRFLNGGKEVAVHSGFTHGDSAGVYALHDTDTGRELDRFPSKDKKMPDWVKQLK
jgi:hypothetical protein